MGKEFGDKDEHQGRTRAEVIAEMGEEALIAAMAEEVLDAHGKTFYGEDRPNKRVTFEDRYASLRTRRYKQILFSLDL